MKCDVPTYNGPVIFHNRIREFEAHCPALKEAVTQAIIDPAPLQAARRLQDVAVALAKKGLLEQLEKTQGDLQDLESQ